MKKSHMLKRSFSEAIAVLIAVIVSFHFSLNEKFWLIMTTILVMQTAIGLTLRQGLERFIVIAFGAALGTSLVLLINYPWIIYGLAIIAFSVGCFYSLKNSLNYFALSIPFLLGFILLLTMVLPAENNHVLSSRLYDITLGAIIGILTNLLIFPSRVDVEFRENMVQVLNSYSDYLTSIVNLLFKNSDSVTSANEKKYHVEYILQAQTAFFPAWVYESGFSVSMRVGHRHFLIMIERVGQILFSMNNIARQKIDLSLLHVLQDPLMQCVKQAKELMTALTTVLSLKKISEGVSDFHEELTALETAFKKAVPLSLELIDISEDYIYLASFIQDLKDLQTALLRLAVSLRGENQE